MSVIRSVEATVTSLSWIPSEAVTGSMRPVFEFGFAHYDPPPPARIDDLDALRAADRFRFANVLGARVEYDGDTVRSVRYTGEPRMGSTTMRLGPVSVTVAAIPMPVLRADPEIGDGWVRVRQTFGGKTGAIGPRIRRGGAPTLDPPLVWSTLSLTIRAHGGVEYALEGASAFPRHWVYGPDHALALKAGTTDFAGWMGQVSHDETPWGRADSPVVVTAAETALERTLSSLVMHDAGKPLIRAFGPGDHVLRQGEPGTSLLLLLDGVVRILVDAVEVGQAGPGAVLGERAVREGGLRTATVQAMTAVRIAGVPAAAVDVTLLDELTLHHRREQPNRSVT